MLNLPLLKFEKSTNYLNNQLNIQNNNKQLILDIIANLGLILNTANDEKKKDFNKLLKKSNKFLNTITNNITGIEQLNLEISNIANELTNILTEYKNASKSKAFYIASFSNIKNNISNYVEKFQALELEIENDNKKFNNFINDNNFKYNFESKSENGNDDKNNFKLTSFSVNNEELSNTDTNKNFFEKLAEDQSSNNALPTTNISDEKYKSHTFDEPLIDLEPVVDDIDDEITENEKIDNSNIINTENTENIKSNDINDEKDLKDNISKESENNDINIDINENNTNTDDDIDTENNIDDNVDNDIDDDDFDPKEERINSLTKDFREILIDLSNGKLDKDDIEPMIINCFNEVANLPDYDEPTNTVLSEIDALDHEEEETESILDKDVTSKDFEEIEKNNAKDMAEKNKASAIEASLKNDTTSIPDNTEIFENESNNIFSNFALNDATLKLDEVVDDDYDEENENDNDNDDNDNENYESFTPVDDTEELTIDDIKIEDLIDNIDDLSLTDTDKTEDNFEKNNDSIENKESSNTQIISNKEDLKTTTTDNNYGNCFATFNSIQDDIYNEYESFKPLPNVVNKFKPLTNFEQSKKEDLNKNSVELKPEIKKDPSNLKIDIYEDSFEILNRKVDNINTTPILDNNSNINASINKNLLNTNVTNNLEANNNSQPIISNTFDYTIFDNNKDNDIIENDIENNINNIIENDNTDNVIKTNNSSNVKNITTISNDNFNVHDTIITNPDESINTLSDEKIADFLLENDSNSDEENDNIDDINLEDISINDLDIDNISIEELENIPSENNPDNITIEDNNIENDEIENDNFNNDNFNDESDNEPLVDSADKFFRSVENFNSLDDDLKKDIIAEKIEKIEEATADNETLIISERKNKVYLPYKISELMKYIESYPNVYESLANVVEQEFILPFDYFTKHPFKSRFTETYNLIRNREGYSALTAIQFGLKMISKTNLNPVIIAACKNQTELKSLIYHLDEDNLKNFKYFNIIFDVNPTIKN